MNDIELVIKIPDRIHYGIEKGITVNGSRASQIVLDAVKNGTILPKGHGDLVDLNEMINTYWDGNYMEIHTYELPDIPVIIKAESEEEK